MSSPIRPFRVYALFAVLLLALCAGGCGYGFGADQPSVLKPVEEGELPTIKIRSVDNPTMNASLSHYIRTELRDEMAARQLARWVDSGPADYEIAVVIDKYTYRTWLSRTDYVAQLFSANLQMSATLYRGGTDTVAWSGSRSYSQTYQRMDQQTAARDLVRELIRRLTTRMRQKF